MPGTGRQHVADGEDEARAFDEFYVGTRGRLVHQLYALTANTADAQECVQEAYARAWQRWSRVSGYDDPEAWVRTVARRIATSRWRKAGNRLTAYRRHGEPPPVPGPEPDTVALVSALRRLPEAQREALVLHHLCGRSVQEIADEARVPVGTIKARLSRGRAALAPLLGDDATHEEDSHV
jgi:RNA polymerase sigma-70 factor (ECF subfamily)